MLDREWLKAFVPLGVLDGAQTLTMVGAGSLLAEPPVIWLVTAAHVIQQAAGRPIAAVVSTAEQQPFLVDLTQEYRRHGLTWHPDVENDVAVGLMPQNESWAIRAIPREFCFPFGDMVPSLPCYSMGCPYGVLNGAIPLVMDGIIAGVDSKRRRVFTSAPTFPGNSGGPLLIARLPYNRAGGLTVGSQVLHLAGVMVEVFLVPDPQGLRSPLHLGLAVSIDVVHDLLQSSEVRAEYDRIASAHRAKGEASPKA